MRTVGLGTACWVFGALLMISCSTQKQTGSPDGAGTKGIALGELTVDRCLFYIEGENYSEKSGGDLDLKGGAYGKKCLGSRWGEKPTDFVTYNVNWEETTESVLMVIRAAFENRSPQSYEILLDDRVVYGASLNPTGGYGYTEKEWSCFSIPLGRIEKGKHTLTIRPFNNGGIVNIDCIALGKVA